MFKILFVFVFFPTLLLSDALPENYRLFYKTDDGASVIQTREWEARWKKGDWNGLSIMDRSENRQASVGMEEDGPAPDVLLGFEPNIEICGRSFAVVTFGYGPSSLRGTSNYSYLRIILDLKRPDQSWQIWDIVAEELAFAYPATDLSRAYSITCDAQKIEYVPLP